MVRDELCVFMERNHSIGVHGAPPPRSSPPGLCNVNNLAEKLFPEKSAHIPPSAATGVTFAHIPPCVILFIGLLKFKLTLDVNTDTGTLVFPFLMICFRYVSDVVIMSLCTWPIICYQCYFPAQIFAYTQLDALCSTKQD